MDLCRLFTSGELNDWFRHISMASEDLREEFDALWAAKATPEKYALKVRTHPGQLQITAISKMRNVKKIQVSWSGRLIETYQLPTEKPIIHKNLVATNSLISKLGNPVTEEESNAFLWLNVTPDNILKYFSGFQVAKQLAKADLSLISKFISELNLEGELNSWSVVLMNKANSTRKYNPSDNLSVGCFTRNTAGDTDTYIIKKNHIIGNPTIEFIDIDKKDLERALEMSQTDGDWKKSYPKPKIVREEFRSANNPLLIIYPLDPLGANPKDKNGKPLSDKIIFKEDDEIIIGFAIVFPKSQTNHTVEFAINTDLSNEYYQSEKEFDDSNDNIDDNE